MDIEAFLALLPEGLAPWEEVRRRAQLPWEEALRLAHALKSAGYPVVIGEGSVGLSSGAPSPQFLLPRLRGRLGRPYRYLGTVTSTQEVLRAWREAPEGALVVAEGQTQGRGRLGRVWHSLPGNLHFSLLLQGPGQPDLPFRLGVALAQAAPGTCLKWPNDLLSPDGRKLGGILIETDGERIIVGVGVNVERAPLPTAAALWEFQKVSRVDLLADFLALLETWLAEPPSRVVEAWRTLDATLGKPVRIHTPRGVVEGIAAGLTPGGALLVRTGQGLTAIHTGDLLLGPVQGVVKAQVGQGEAGRGGSSKRGGKCPGPPAKPGQDITHGRIGEARDKQE